MNIRVSVLTGAVAAVAFAVAGIATAGGAGSGCIYGGEMAEVEGQQPLVPADADGNAIDPKWLLMLEQQDDSDATTPPQVVHN